MARFSGFEAPNSTYTPNEFFDSLAREITSLAEMQVTLQVIRHTLGWHRTRCRLTLSQLQELTGMERHSVIDGSKRAVRRGTVKVDPATHEFILNIKGGAKIALDDRAARVRSKRASAKSALEPSADFAPKGVQHSHQQNRASGQKRPVITGKLAGLVSPKER